MANVGKDRVVTSVRRAATNELRASELGRLRGLLEDSFGGHFDEHDWEHALGGTHVIVEADGVPLSHASVVPRTLHVGDHRVATGYVEAVATRPAYQRNGYGTLVMEEVGRVIAEQCELGALSTEVPAFFAKRGWELWAGPTFVSTAAGLVRTADEDGGIMVLRTHATAGLDLGAAVACEWRDGDVW